MNPSSPGKRFREAVAIEAPLQVIGIITAYVARMAEATGFKALYLSGGGVAANSLGMPDHQVPNVGRYIRADFDGNSGALTIRVWIVGNQIDAC